VLQLTIHNIEQEANNFLAKNIYVRWFNQFYWM